MILGYRRVGYIAWGDSPWWPPPWREAALALWPRKNTPDNEIGWHVLLTVLWRWPPRVYQTIAPPPDVLGSSAAWTGREVRFTGFDWARGCWPDATLWRIP